MSHRAESVLAEMDVQAEAGKMLLRMRTTNGRIAQVKAMSLTLLFQLLGSISTLPSWVLPSPRHNFMRLLDVPDIPYQTGALRIPYPYNLK
jgi:hypothetical protein